ncbi:MAG: AEC family transporter [Chloroflexi bacterium]|nr:AEC family transporter [Chloroflexota bacterium]
MTDRSEVLVLSTVVQVFVEIVLPIFAMVGVGYALARTRGIPPGPISTITLYLFAPALTFSALTRTTLAVADALGIVLFSVLFTAVMYVLSVAIARSIRMDRPTESAFLLTTLFMNAGNFGLSLTLLAFGEEGLQRAVVFFVCQATMGNSLGVFLASRSNAGVLDSLKATARMPLVYAAFAAVAVTLLGLPVPSLIAKPAEILGNAAIPSMLVVLGAQLAANPKIGEDLHLVAGVSGVRLLLAAVVALGLTWVMGIGGLTQQVLILQASMPTAVFTIIIATEFGANPRFVTSVVVVSTLVSLLTVTLLLSLLLGMTPP